MDKKRTRTLDAQVSSLSKLDQNAPLFVGFSQYPALKDKIDLGITKSTDLSKRKMFLESLTSAERTNSRLTLNDADLILSSKMMSLALVNEDALLYDSVKLTKTGLRALNDSLFLHKTDILIGAAEDNITDLAQYGETPASIAVIKAKRDTFKAEVAKMIDIQEELTTVNEQLTQELKHTEKVFKKVDSLVNSMSETQPVFYNMYWTARARKPTGGSKVTARVKVYDAVTNQPLPGATLIVARVVENGKSLTSGAELVKNVKVRSAGGGVDLKALPPGVYTFTINYYGYAQQTITVYVNEGVLSKVDFSLNKLD